jgi:hypothetical protein
MDCQLTNSMRFTVAQNGAEPARVVLPAKKDPKSLPVRRRYRRWPHDPSLGSETRTPAASV